MADESYGSVGTPRIFCDIIQYGRAIGIFEQLHYNGISLSTNPEALWDMNPSNVATFEITSQSDGSFAAYARIFSDSDYDNLQFRHLLSTANYGALLGHNISTIDPERYVESKVQQGYASQSGILGRNTARQNVGTNIWKINSFVSNTYDLGDMKYFDRLGFKINRGNDGIDWNVGQTIKIGAFSTGRYFDLPHSANLSLNQTISYDGVQTKRTIGGSDLIQVNYTRPKWGDYTPFHNIDLSDSTNHQATIDNNDFSTAGFQGRRSWDLSFSYISKEDMFPRTFTNNTAGYYDYDDTQEFDDGGNSTGMYNDNIVNNWLNLTLGGQIPFIFQPDKNKTEFAIVKIDKPSMKIEQVAHQVYDFSVKLIEVF